VIARKERKGRIMASAPAQQPAETPPTATVEQRFRRLATAWHDVAPSHPRHPARYDHPVYQEVVSLGPAVIPYLLGAMCEHPRDWFWALHRITGADPIAPTERGDPGAMRDGWLRWGRERGYLPEPAAGANGNPGPAAPPREGPDPTLEKEFQRLAAIWRAETCYLSSSTAIVNHPAYQEILGLGPAAVPWILRELEQRPALWFHALRTLTGADPMTPADDGKVRKLAEAWLQWGKANGYRW
jgi:hypothetical protein